MQLLRNNNKKACRVNSSAGFFKQVLMTKIENGKVVITFKDKLMKTDYLHVWKYGDTLSLTSDEQVQLAMRLISVEDKLKDIQKLTK